MSGENAYRPPSRPEDLDRLTLADTLFPDEVVSFDDAGNLGQPAVHVYFGPSLVADPDLDSRCLDREQVAQVHEWMGRFLERAGPDGERGGQ